MSTNHGWKFFRAGGFDQVRLDTGADLVALEQLDQKLWVALACPISGLEFSAKTLSLIDRDKDGRLRAPEILAAVKWACGCLKNPNDLLKGSSQLELSSINDATPEGKQLLASARQILVNLGKADATAITVEDISDTGRIFAQTRFNGDGIIPPESADDELTAGVIKDIMGCLGSVPDRSAKPGIDQARVDKFFTEAQAFSDWWKAADADPAVRLLKDATPEAGAILKAVRAKVEDYFARCRLAAFDPRALSALNREEKEYLALAAKDLTITSVEIAGFPLALIGASRPLSLQDKVNPAWEEIMTVFAAKVVTPVLGPKAALTEADWSLIKAKFAAFEAWTAAKPLLGVEKLGLVRLRQILDGKTRETINALLARDKALEPEANSMAAVEKLVLFGRDLYKLLNNFVSFRDFYSRKSPAIFQIGTLYLDQRSCDLCLPVEDAAKHASMAILAGTYLAYCDCFRKATGQKLQIVAAFTAGDSDNLMVGRNGIFYDRKGQDWDATITKIVDHPISISQAFWSPYKKLIRFVEEQVAKRASAADATVTTQLQTTAQQATALEKPKVVEPPRKIDTGTLAAIGLVLTTLLGALGSIFGRILGLSWWQIPLAIVGIVLAISLPSMIIAWLKLRKRNLGPILDANGWAINAKAKMNVPFGGVLTQTAALPPGSSRDLVDPYAEKKRPWKLYISLGILLLLTVCWYLGKLDGLLPLKLKSTDVMGINAPAYKPLVETPAPAPAPAANPAPAPPPAPAVTPIQ
jgi:hypothetical protein